MTSTGEEASVVGSASGLEDNDLVYSQYREQGVLMYRGWSIRQFADQVYQLLPRLHANSALDVVCKQ